MIDNTSESHNKSVPSASTELPDLWEEQLQPQEPKIYPLYQSSLDTTHEITAAPTPDGILSPASDPSMSNIAPHTSESTSDPAEILLQEEIKVNATQAKSLWNQIRDLLALWWWTGPRDKQLN